MKLIAKKSFSYGGKQLQPGEAFEATDKHGKLLKAIRKAEDADATAAGDIQPRARPRRPAGRTGEMKFPDAPNTYGRRDMRAED